ncbi:hypothetical protein F5Y19DRAFT_450284 [Xylariaceae sp. FL1651]|nr:hypothetical protein F5Y19DRAFT_450284 [Xylariaceae sp. FL1651]
MLRPPHAAYHAAPHASSCMSTSRVYQSHIGVTTFETGLKITRHRRVSQTITLKIRLFRSFPIFLLRLRLSFLFPLLHNLLPIVAPETTPLLGTVFLNNVVNWAIGVSLISAGRLLPIR